MVGVTMESKAATREVKHRSSPSAIPSDPMIAPIARHRTYIARTAWRDVRHRHVGSVGGAAWNVLRPLALIAVFTIVFGQIMTQRGSGEFEGIRFTLYLCAALLPWSAFAEVVGRSTHALVGGAPYLRKLAIEEEVFIAQGAVSAAISLAISFGLLAVLALALGLSPAWTWLLAPIPMALLMLVGLGVGTALGTVFVFVRDIKHLVEIALHVGFWTVPIVYDPAIVPAWFQKTFPFNPVHPFLEAVRTLFLRGVVPPWDHWAVMLAWTVASLALGQVVLSRLRSQVRDNL